MQRGLSLGCLAVLAAVVTAPPLARAQDAAESAPNANAVTPPRLVRSGPPELAPELVPERETRALLELVIDETGHVTDASVIESAGAELDRAALAAVRRFEFEPARQGDTAVAVKIRYAFAFEPKPPPAPAPEAAPVPAPAPADSLTVAPEPRKPAPPAAAPSAGGAPLEEFESTASIEAPPREVTRRSIDQETIRRLPGTRGDTLRAIEILPGVARTSFGDGTPILRGAAFNESQTYLNGTPVPFLYHIGELTSFVSPRMVERVDLYPGNFSVRYGRIAGGAIEVKTRDPESKRLRLAVDLSVIDSSAFLETPLGEDAGIALAARRSNLDLFFESFVPEDAYSVVAAPLYYDYQLLGFYELGSATRLRLLGYGSRDTLELFFSRPPDEDPAIAGSVAGDVSFHRVGLELESRPNTGVSGSISATVGVIDQTINFGSLISEFDGQEIHARAETSVELHSSLRLTLGGDLYALLAGGRYRGPAPGQTDGDPTWNGSISSQRLITAEDDAIDVVRPGAYLELAFRPIAPLLLLPGVRFDYMSDTQATAIDPRLAVRYEVGPQTTLKAGVGSFSQSPEWWQVLPSVGNPKLDFYRALHSSAGVEQKLGDSAKLGVEGFYKHLYDTVVNSESVDGPPLENAGRGRIYGGELAFDARWASRGNAYVAYTLSRSERNDHGEGYRLFDSDQTHILSLVASQGLGKGWEVGARFRLVTGNPVTPITGAVYDARSGVYVPQYGAVNSERNTAFHQLDLRVEKAFQVGPVTLAAYLDLLNAYNAKNEEGMPRYSFDYRERETTTGLPILPNLGLRGEL